MTNGGIMHRLCYKPTGKPVQSFEFAAVDYLDAAAARDKSLAEFCEDVLQILIEMKAPGCQWLWLTEVE